MAANSHDGRVKLAWESIVQHPLFRDIVNAPPLEITNSEGSAPEWRSQAQTVSHNVGMLRSKQSSHTAAFDASLADTALETRGLYLCGGNLSWLSLSQSEPEVPVCERALQFMIDMYWKDTGSLQNRTGTFVSPISVKISREDFAKWRAGQLPDHGKFSDYILAHRGKLQMLSPSEMRDSLVLHLASLVTAQKEQNFEMYKRLVLSAEMKFHLVENDAEAKTLTIICREKTGTDYVGLYLTAVQRLFQLYDFNQWHPSLNGQKSADMLQRQWEKSGITITAGESAHVGVSHPQSLCTWLWGCELTAQRNLHFESKVQSCPGACAVLQGKPWYPEGPAADG